MTITFDCPKCGGICAFGDQRIGKRARCTRCNERFIIPSEDGGKAERVKVVYQEDGPTSGFYHALFKENRKIFANSSTFTALVFIAVVTAVRFFTAQNFYITISFMLGSMTFYVPFDYIMELLTYGCLFWYYMDVIYSTAFGADALPLIYFRGLVTFVCNIIRSLYIFFIISCMTMLGLIIVIVISENYDLHLVWLYYVLAVVGLFIFPAPLLVVSVGKDISLLLNPKNFFEPIRKAIKPYLLIAILLTAAVAVQYKSARNFRVVEPGLSVIIHLLANIASAFFAVFVSRAIGLFGRHYSCYLP